MPGCGADSLMQMKIRQASADRRPKGVLQVIVENLLSGRMKIIHPVELLVPPHTFVV